MEGGRRGKRTVEIKGMRQREDEGRKREEGMEEGGEGRRRELKLHHPHPHALTFFAL